MGCGFGLLCVSAVLTTRLIAAGPTQVRSAEPSDAYSRSVALLKLAYPELAGQGLVVMVNGDEWTEFDAVVPLRSMILTVARQGVNSHEAPKPLLTARILWTMEPHTLFELNVSGEVVDDRRQSEARRFTHRDTIPSSNDVQAKLVELNARFTTEAAMRDHAKPQLARLARQLGRIELQKITLAIDGPFWHATVVISTPTGRREYAVLFEPFEGRLVSMGGLR